MAADWQVWAGAATCVGDAALVLLSLRQGSRASAVRIPLIILCAIGFWWNFAATAHALSDFQPWSTLDRSVSPLTAPAALEVVLAFTGESRRWRVVRWASWVLLGGLGLLTSAALIDDAWRLRGTSWPALHVSLALPVLGFLIWRLLVHARRAATHDERMRTRLVLAAFAVGTAFGLTELAASLRVPVVRLGPVGTLASTTLLAIATLRLRLLDRQPHWSAGLYAVAVGAIAVLGYFAVFHFARGSAATAVLGAATVTVVLGVALRTAWASLAMRREQTERLVLLGRLSAQMAHDLNNPLAALRGAVQLLEAGAAGDASLASQADLLALMRGQVDRLAAMIAKYRRLGTTQPSLAPVSLDEVVRAAVALAAPGGAGVQTELEPAPCRADADLVASLVENLVRNAVEASPPDAIVRVTTRPVPDGAELCVEDRGAGMSPRVLDRAFDEFFTTKPDGTGLGLPFVRRIVDAHQGRIEIESREGEGTRVRVWLPAA